MKTLVTGGAGFIGSHVARHLVSLGHDVRIVDNLSSGHLENLAGLSSDVEFIHADVSNPDVCRDAAEGIDTIFHIAAMPSVPRSLEEPLLTHASNINGTLYLLEAARQAGVRRFVYSSSSSVYGDTPDMPKVESMEPLPRSPYAVQKLCGEQYTLAYARAGLVEGVALRYFNIFGPRQDPNGPYAAVIPLVFRAATSGTPMAIYGDGLQTRDFTYIDNVVNANLLAALGDALQVSGQVVNIGAGQRISLLDLVELVQEITGRPVHVTHRAPRAGDVRDSLASLDRARDVLGYAPNVSLREGTERLWAFMESDVENVARLGA